MHVETVCAHPADGWHYDEVAETRNVLDEAAALGVPCNICAYVDIKAPDAAQVIAAHRAVAGSTLVAVRNILNFDSANPALTWPNITRDYFKEVVPELETGCVGACGSTSCSHPPVSRVSACLLAAWSSLRAKA